MLDLIESDCYLCGAKERGFWGEENGFKAWKCAVCGLVYVSPRPSDQAISAANRMGEHRTGAGRTLDIGHWSDRKVERYKRIFSSMFGDVIARGERVTWLDVGAGFGEAVAALRMVLPKGSSVIGVEPMAPKVAEAQKRGLPVLRQDLSAITGTFDFISLINVFSHIPDFASFMVTIKGLLAPNGELYFESSNGGDLISSTHYPDALFLPDHLMFGGFHTLQRFLEPLGFTVTAKRAERRDTALWSIKSAVKVMIGRQAKVTIPYRSTYRIIMVRESLSALAKARAA
jgi:SAM-dependent methyltransferase